MKKLLIALALVLCSCLDAFSQATDLTIDNQTPGWLSSKITQDDRQTVENLKVTGYVNLTDLRFIGSLMENRNLHGCVDLSEVYVVGEKDNYMGNGSFNSEGTVRRLMLPKTLEEVEQCLVTSTPNSSYYKYLHVDTLVFDPDNIHFVEGSFFSELHYRPNYNPSNILIGVPAHLIIGESVDSIPKDAFNYVLWNQSYNELLSVSFNGKIRYVGSDAFKGTGVHMTRTLAEKLLDEADYIAPRAFTCSIDSLHVPARWETYNLHTFTINSGGHVFFEKNLKTLTKISKDYISDIHLHFKTMGPPNIAERLTPGGSIYIYVPKGARAAYEAKAEQFSSNLTIIEETPVESVSINSHELLMEKETTMRLSVTILPTDADDKTLKWNSQDESIAIVDEKGNVTGVAPGTTIIYATSVATGLQDECEVTVIQHATDIQMETPQVTMTKLGETEQLNVTVLPENTTDKTVKWSSSNPSICTVTASGKIVAMGYGDAVIMAVTNDGEIPATCVVKVARPKYKLTYMVDGIEYQSDEYEAGKSVSLIAAPEKDNQMFVGWSIDMPTDDVTLTAIYAPITSIDAIKSATGSFQIFTPDGIRRNVLQPGVNILRYSDGSEKKVVIQ